MMASSSNIGLLRFPWGKLPRSPLASKKGGNPLEISFRDIMDEQERESCQDEDFDEYIENSFVNVSVSSPEASPPPEELPSPDVEKSFMQLEDLDKDLNMVMSFYEDQDFDDASYELSEQDVDELDDDDSDKYYEGLAKKLSTVVELQTSTTTTTTSSLKGNKGSRTKTTSPQSSLRASSAENNASTALDSESKVTLDKLKQKGILKGTFIPIHVGNSATVLFGAGGMLKRRDDAINTVNSSASSIILKLRLPKECAIKVFKNPEENKTEEEQVPPSEVEEEPRLVEAKREMTHLNRMTRAGIPCPQVQFLHKHLLVTDFVGKEAVAARKLKDAQDLTNSRTAMKAAYEQITNNMKTLFKTCHLVHGDLSEANILWHKRKAYFTNVANAVNSNRPQALELLFKDCANITEFFEKKGKSGCRSPQDLFHWITGFDYTGQRVDCSTEQDFAIV